ncbi:MAG TPA: response regulator transcription factor [Gammaproteobacteria bacterium]
MGIQLLLVSDVPLYRDGIARTLAGTHELTIVGTASSREQTLELVCCLQPDVVLLDMNMARAFELAREITRSTVATRVVALAIKEEDSEVIACAEAGISGYVPRGGSLRDAVGVISAVARGEAHCPPRIVGSLLRRIAALAAERQAGGHGNGTAGLTAREAEILALLRQGLSNKMISRRLGIELATVKNHVHSVFGKLGLRRRAEAAVLVQTDAKSAKDDDQSSLAAG